MLDSHWPLRNSNHSYPRIYFPRLYLSVSRYQSLVWHQRWIVFALSFLLLPWRRLWGLSISLTRNRVSIPSSVHIRRCFDFLNEVNLVAQRRIKSISVRDFWYFYIHIRFTFFCDAIQLQYTDTKSYDSHKVLADIFLVFSSLKIVSHLKRRKASLTRDDLFSRFVEFIPLFSPNAMTWPFF